MTRYVNRHTGNLQYRMDDRKFRRLVQSFLADELKVYFPKTVWLGLIIMVQELRRNLGLNKRNVTTKMGWWMKEMIEITQWNVKLTKAEQAAHAPNCNAFACNCVRESVIGIYNRYILQN